MAGDDRNLYVQTIADVIDHYGYAQIAARLKVRQDDLDRWVSGERRPPAAVFFEILHLKERAKSKEIRAGGHPSIASVPPKKPAR